MSTVGKELTEEFTTPNSQLQVKIFLVISSRDLVSWSRLVIAISWSDPWSKCKACAELSVTSLRTKCLRRSGRNFAEVTSCWCTTASCVLEQRRQEYPEYSFNSMITWTSLAWRQTAILKFIRWVVETYVINCDSADNVLNIIALIRWISEGIIRLHHFLYSV